jgi:hypothetical protein
MPAVEPSRPAVRASHLKEDLLALSSLGAEVEARVLERLRRETRRAIEESTRVDWLPVELNVELAEAVHAEAGARGSRLWGKRSIVQSLDTALFRPLVATAVALFGLTPAAFYRYVPKAWPAVYRDCGGLTAEIEGADRARVVAGRLPAPMRRDAFLEAVAGTFEGAFEFCKVEGQVILEPRPLGSDQAVYLATWQPR